MSAGGSCMAAQLLIIHLAEGVGGGTLASQFSVTTGPWVYVENLDGQNHRSIPPIWIMIGFLGTPKIGKFHQFLLNFFAKFLATIFGKILPTFLQKLCCNIFWNFAKMFANLCKLCWTFFGNNFCYFLQKLCKFVCKFMFSRFWKFLWGFCANPPSRPTSRHLN